MNGPIQSGFTGVGTPHLHAQLVFDLLKLLVGVPISIAVRTSKSAVADRERCQTIEHLRETLQLLGYGCDTARKYAVCVRRFLCCVGGSKLANLRDDDVYVYLEELKAGGLSNATLRLHLCAIRAVFDRLLGLHITSGIDHAPRPPVRLPASAEQIEQLRDACKSTQDRLVVDLLNGLKLRPSQLVRLVLHAQSSASPLLPKSPDVRQEERKQGIIIPLINGSSAVCGTRRWLLPSSRSRSCISTRTVQRVIERLSRSCGFHVTCTAIRLAERVPLQSVA